MIASHSHDRTLERAALLKVLAISVVFLFLEVAGGIIGNSLALLADAAHLLTDVSAIGIALVGFWVAGRVGGRSWTFGYARAETMAAVVNGLSLVLIAAWISFEAVRRLSAVGEVDGPVVLGIAVAGLAANAVGVAILRRSAAGNLNVQGVLIHLAGDSLASVAVIVSAIVIMFSGWNTVDPIVAIVIAVLILIAAARLLLSAVKVLMESAPPGIRPAHVNDVMLGVGGVQSVHDLHIWTLTSGCVAMTAHVMPTEAGKDADLLKDLRASLKSKFDIGHLTLQIEGSLPTDEVGHFRGRPECQA